MRALVTHGPPYMAFCLILNTSLAKTRIPTRIDDFGDADTVGLCVKRIGSTPLTAVTPDHEADFGIYLGKHGDKYAVVVKHVFDWADFTGCELFESLEDLKRRWELD